MPYSTENDSSLSIINNTVKSYGESYSGPEGNFNVDYVLNVGPETSTLEIDVQSGDLKMKLFKSDFKTNEGITVSKYFIGMMKIASDKNNFIDYTDVVVSCHPVFLKSE